MSSHQGIRGTHFVLIGLQYSHDKRLPGIVIDLHRMHRYLVGRGYPESGITIITDITGDTRPPGTSRPVANDSSGVEVFGFIERQRKLGRLIFVENPSTCKACLRSCLIECLGRYQNLLVYYTGHGIGWGKEKGCLMTDHGIWDIRDIVKLHVKHGHVDQSIIWLMDCCGVGTLPLPYRFVQDRFRLDRSSSGTVQRTRSKVLFITATSHEEKSVTSSSGSAFTSSMVRLLESSSSLEDLFNRVTKSIRDLNTGYPQTIGIVSSHPLSGNIPSWIRDSTRSF